MLPTRRPIATVSPTRTPPPTAARAATPTPVLLSTSAPTPSATVALAPAERPSEQQQLVGSPLAVVEVAALNVRSGPGANYDPVTVANKGAVLVIQSQINNCAWLSITTQDGVDGWVVGGSRYVMLDTRCADIPEATPPATAPASNQGSSGASSGGSSSAASEDGTSRSANPTQGCYLFQNQLGPELTISFTNSSSGKGSTFKVPGSGEFEQCFDPGKYTYTLDAPPPWASTNGELTVEAGDTFLFPITAR